MEEERSLEYFFFLKFLLIKFIYFFYILATVFTLLSLPIPAPYLSDPTLIFSSVHSSSFSLQKYVGLPWKSPKYGQSSFTSPCIKTGKANTLQAMFPKASQHLSDNC